MIIIDGKSFNVEWLKGNPNLEWNIINGDNSGRIQGTKEMFLDYVGTFYKYKGVIIRQKNCTDAMWYEFLQVLGSPLNVHSWSVPFMGGTMVWDFYCSQGNLNFISKASGTNLWDKQVSVELVPLKSQWLAGQNLQTY